MKWSLWRATLKFTEGWPLSNPEVRNDLSTFLWDFCEPVDLRDDVEALHKVSHTDASGWNRAGLARKHLIWRCPVSDHNKIVSQERGIQFLHEVQGVLTLLKRHPEATFHAMTYGAGILYAIRWAPT